jgi:Spy/CpxP family protein refolding chaperone
MKKLATAFGILILVSVLVTPVFAYRGGWGGWMRGPGYCWDEGRFSGNLNEDQRTEMNKLERNFFKETSKVRDQLWTKSDEFDILLDSTDPDPKKVRKLQKDISNLRAQLAEKRIDLELEVRKVAPDAGYARGYGRGYGRHMRGYGPRGGYGPGGCGY